MRSTRIRSRLLAGGIGALWLVVVGFGVVYLTAYSNAPGPVGEAPPDWPRESTAMPGIGIPTLVLFAHPRCPCTRASIGELATLIAQVGRPVRTHVFFYKPADKPDAWVRTDLWTGAEAIPGVTPHVDPEGREARRFGAMTSGHTLLFDAEQRLRFSGGITGARGHQGDNAGRSALYELITQGETERETTFVFGCALYSMNSLSIMK